MKRPMILILPLLALILAACTPAKAQAPTAQSLPPTISAETRSGSLARADQQGAVSVTVTPLNLDKPGSTLDFNVSLQTHSVDLSMDLAALSTLKTDTGLAVKGSAWKGPSGGHHVNGTLSFPASQDGKNVLDGARQLTVTIQNVDAPERVFTWDLSR